MDGVSAVVLFLIIGLIFYFFIVRRGGCCGAGSQSGHDEMEHKKGEKGNEKNTSCH